MLFIMLTQLTGEEVHPEHHSLEELEKKVKTKIAKACPKVKWVSNYAIFSQYDYLDIFTAPSLEDAMKVSALVRSFGHASTEIWPALEWKEFKKVISDLPGENDTSLRKHQAKIEKETNKHVQPSGKRKTGNIA